MYFKSSLCSFLNYAWVCLNYKKCWANRKKLNKKWTNRVNKFKKIIHKKLQNWTNEKKFNRKLKKIQKNLLTQYLAFATFGTSLASLAFQMSVLERLVKIFLSKNLRFGPTPKQIFSKLVPKRAFSRFFYEQLGLKIICLASHNIV